MSKGFPMSYDPRFALYNVEGRYGYVRGLMVCFDSEEDGQAYLDQMTIKDHVQQGQDPWRVVDMRQPNNVLFLETTKQDHRYLLWSGGQLAEKMEDHLGAVTEDDLESLNSQDDDDEWEVEL
jgi:hypothetical protein